MPIIGVRQTKFDCGEIPTIELSKKIDIKGFESISERLIEALNEKYDYCFSNKEVLINCVNQTIHLLKELGAHSKEIKKKIKLWKELYDLSPAYEAYSVALNSELTKFHFPRMHEAMSKGAVYSHVSLTGAREAVSYTMEFFKKEKLFGEVK